MCCFTIAFVAPSYLFFFVATPALGVVFFLSHVLGRDAAGRYVRLKADDDEDDVGDLSTASEGSERKEECTSPSSGVRFLFFCETMQVFYFGRRQKMGDFFRDCCFLCIGYTVSRFGSPCEIAEAGLPDRCHRC